MTLLIFIIILSVLVFIHELGHFLAAKRAKMGVEEFGFGFPPRLFGIQKQNGTWKVVWGSKGLIKSETVYSINAIPAGGFVRITGEDNPTGPVAPNSFVNKSFLSRLLVLCAGVLMNIVLAFVIYSLSFYIGAPVLGSSSEDFSNQTVTGGEVVVYQVVPESLAAKAGLTEGDEILSIDDQTFTDTPPVVSYIKANAGKEFVFKIKRNGEEVTTKVQSNATPAEGQGPTGISLGYKATVHEPAHKAIVQGAKATYYGFISIPMGLYQVIESGLGFKALGGPVKIYQETGKVQKQSGTKALLPFTAFLSLNLAFLNILPIPALDGGRVMFLVIEKIRRKKNRQIIEQYANGIGFLLLLALLIGISIKDFLVR